MRYLLDTNVLSELVRPTPDPRVIAWVAAQPPLDLAISVLTLGELAKGVRACPAPERSESGGAAGRRRDELERWVSVALPAQFVGRLLEIDAATAVAWGKLAGDARNGGRPLPVIDGLLLATASVHGLVLVSRNAADCAGRGVPLIELPAPERSEGGGVSSGGHA